MKHSILYSCQRIVNSSIDHLCTIWYRLFLGSVGKNTLIRRHCRLDGDSLDSISIGSNCTIDSYCVIGARCRLRVNDNEVIPQLTIGCGCTIGQYNHITAVNKISIGNNVLTGRFVLITDNSHGQMTKDELLLHPSARQVVSKGEVVIGNNVWIGDKVSIMAGVHIGDGCIIGANSVVTHNMPSNSLIAGIPARVVRTID